MTDRNHQPLVRRLSDGKVLPVIAEHGEEICVKEPFEYGDGGTSPRFLYLWHPKTSYEPVDTPGKYNPPASCSASLLDLNLAAILLHRSEPLAPHHVSWLREHLRAHNDDELREMVHTGKWPNSGGKLQ